MRAETHAEHGGRLQDTMRHLQKLMLERKAAVNKTDELREQYLKDLIDTAGEVLHAAEILVNHGPVQDLGPGQRHRFYDLADRLYAQAANVENQARQSNFMDMDEAYRRLDETCNNCHRLFRDQ